VLGTNTIGGITDMAGRDVIGHLLSTVSPTTIGCGRGARGDRRGGGLLGDGFQPQGIHRMAGAPPCAMAVPLASRGPTSVTSIRPASARLFSSRKAAQALLDQAVT
jgi:hypothetical protein